MSAETGLYTIVYLRSKEAPTFLLPTRSKACAASRTVSRAASRLMRHRASCCWKPPCCAMLLRKAVRARALSAMNSRARSPIPVPSQEGQTLSSAHRSTTTMDTKALLFHSMHGQFQSAQRHARLTSQVCHEGSNMSQ